MGLTVTARDYDVQGKKRVVYLTFTFDSTYPAGGEPLSLDLIGLKAVGYSAPAVTTTGYLATYIPSTSKVKVWYGDNNNAADGPFIENATTDLSAESCTIKFESA